MKRDPGDVIDRYSIALLKRQRIGGFDAKLEASVFCNGYEQLKRMYVWVEWSKLLGEMLHINGEIWDLESELRLGALDDDLCECGRIAVIVRKVNAKRVAFKNYINKALEQGVQDVKEDHISSGAPVDFITFEEFCTTYVLPRGSGPRK